MENSCRNASIKPGTFAEPPARLNLLDVLARRAGPEEVERLLNFQHE